MESKGYINIKVGKDVIENAEYLVFDENENLLYNETSLSVWDKITIPFWRIKDWIRHTYWIVYYGFQRMFKGYDEEDVFETFYMFIKRYTKILTDYRKHHVGYVGTMTNEEWEAIIDEMLYHLHYMDEEVVIDELMKDVPDNWMASQITINSIMHKHKDEFFKLFSEYFYDLWD